MYIISKGHNGDWWCLSKKGSWTWLIMIFIISKGQKKPKNTVFSKAQQPGQEKMDVWAFFSLGLESIYSWTKKFTYVIIILMIDLEFGYGKEMGSRQLGEIQLCFLFVCIFVFFFVFSSSSWADSFGLSSWRDIWPFLLPRQLLSSQTYVSILFRFFSWFFFSHLIIIPYIPTQLFL